MCTVSYKHVYTLENKRIFKFHIENPTGSFVEFLNYGATLTAVVVPDKTGQHKNVILSYDNIDEYLTDTCYLGSSIGRLANRLSNARFRLNGNSYNVDRNCGNHSIHGGFYGFNSKILDFIIYDDNVMLFGISNDGESGFPGRILFAINYRFTENNELVIGFEAYSDINTPLNLTNHAYFNLSKGGNLILDHELKINADSYLEVDDEFIPTGRVLPTSNVAFNFDEFKKIGSMMAIKNEIFRGYNTYFITNGTGDRKELRHQASVKENESGIMLDMYSTMPGIMFYTGDYLNGKHSPFGGFCLEAQHYPDFPNHPEFPSSFIGPDRNFHEKIKFRFGLLQDLHET